MSLPPSFDAKLVRARMLSPAVRELVLERDDGASLAFEAGQWVNVHLPLAGGDTKRAYSIASPPDGTPRFELAVTRVDGGAASTHLHAMQPGEALHVTGPLGLFTHAPGGPSLFVGTGTGVAPLRSMLRDELARGAKAPLWLLFGARRQPDVLWREELEALAAAHANVRLVVTLSRPDAGWTGRTGWVQEHVRALWEELAKASGSTPHAYVCGLERMVGAVRDLLRKDMGVPRQHVHSERYD